MNFLFPGFLFVLVAVIIPVIIHLFNFQRYKKVYFSNVRFLKDIQQRTSSFRKLKNYLLLLFRILAIVFLVLAFARPYIPAGDENAAGKQAVVSIYVDNSYSMEAVGSEGRLLDEAKTRAREILSAYDLNTRFQLLTNDFEGRHQRILYREDFLNALEEVEISPVHRSLDRVIHQQRTTRAAEANSINTYYLISDFQNNTAFGKRDTLSNSGDIRLIQLKANPQPNISVDTLWFISPVHKAGETEKLVIQLKNNSDKKAENVSYKLNIDNQQKSIGSLSIPERGIAKDTLSFSGLSAGWKTGEIVLKDYPITFDDLFYFSFHVERQMSILEIDENAPNKYLRAIYSTDPFFRLSYASVGNIDYSNLGAYPLVILNSLSSISEGLAQQLGIYVKNGGSLMVFPALDSELEGLRTLTRRLHTDQPVALISQEQKVNAINLQNPLFKGVFDKVPDKLNLPFAKRYIRYSNQSRKSKQEILSFPGNGTFLSEYRLGKGKVYLSAVPLAEEESNLVRHSVFVPLMFQSAFLSVRDSRLFYTIGEDEYLESSKITLSPTETLLLRKGKFEAIPDLRQSETLSRIFIADQVKEPGIYELIEGGTILSNYAFNNNRIESDLSYLSEKEIKNIFPGAKAEVFSPGKEPVSDAIKAVNKGVQLWKLCLILALVCLALEILVIRFYSAGKKQ